MDTNTDVTLSLPEECAFHLSRTAIALDKAREAKSANDLALALRENMDVWMAIRSFASRPDCLLPKDAVANLDRLGRYVSERTLAEGTQMPADVVSSLVNINLQISEGLLEGIRR